MELTEFIAARLAEEEPAKVCGCLDTNHWPPCSPQPWTDRIWRELAAKRLIVKLHDRVHECPVIVPVGNPEAFAEGMYVSTEYVDGEDPDVSPCTTLRALGAVWSDHADYRPEWAPLG
jgi:hypothetical protein